MRMDYSDIELKTFDTDELRDILQENIWNDEEFDYRFVRRIIEIIAEREPDPILAEYLKQAHDYFWSQYANTTALFEDIIAELRVH